MAANGMEHQDLSQATNKVGCNLFIGGENVAQNNAGYGGVAEEMMQQWKGSPGHFENIINQEDGSYIVVGVYKAPDGKMWGTQTFGSGDCSCPLIGGGGGSYSPATEAPKAPASGGGDDYNSQVPETPKAPVESGGDGYSQVAEAPKAPVGGGGGGYSQTPEAPVAGGGYVDAPTATAQPLVTYSPAFPVPESGGAPSSGACSAGDLKCKCLELLAVQKDAGCEEFINGDIGKGKNIPAPYEDPLGPSAPAVARSRHHRHPRR